MTPDQDLSARLDPCHFCGGYYSEIADVSVAEYPHPKFHVQCVACGLSGPIAPSEHEAEKLWNLVHTNHERAVQAAVAKAVEAITAERDAAQAELRIALGGCDANGGWNHRPISIPSAPKDIFCQDCGEMLDKATAKRHLSAAANRTPSETPTAIRSRGVAG